MAVTSHLYLVSAQATPNLTPALDPAVAPRRVVLLVSPDMRQRAEWLEAVLEVRGIRVVHWPIEDAWDIEHVQTRVMELIEHAQPEPGAKPDIALNATGGTKPMSIAAYEVFRAYDLPIFYVHPETDRLIWMHPPGQAPVDLADRVRLEAFLMAHGAQVEGDLVRDRPHEAQLELAGELVRDIGRFQRALGALNWLAGSAERGLVSKPMTDHHQRDDDLLDLIDRFGELNLLRREGDCLAFSDEAARFYVNGGWLELYVFAQVRALSGGARRLQDSARSVQVIRESRGQPVRNELDVAALADNRLYIVECKTRSWRSADEDGPAAEALYKLDALGDLLGGLQAKAMLVSYRSLKDHDRRRAADLGIAVCAGQEVQRLSEHLKGWIR